MAQARPQSQHTAPSEALAGTVERVTFHNAENGFCVLKVQARGKRDQVTVAQISLLRRSSSGHALFRYQSRSVGWCGATSIATRTKPPSTATRRTSSLIAPLRYSPTRALGAPLRCG